MGVNRDIILIIKGGTIRGVFGAGVMTAFEKHNLYPRLHSIYAASSGSHNAAYFLAHNTQEGSRIYYDYFSKKNYFIKDLSSKIVCQKIWQLFLRGKSFDIVDLDYVRHLETEVIKLDVEAIQKSPINFYIRVFNPKTLQFEYLDGKVNTLDRLTQSSYVPPYVYTKIKNDRYFDGGIMPTRDFIENVVKKYPDKIIIYIFNKKISFGNIIKYLPQDLLDALFKTRYLGTKYGFKHLFNIFNYPNLSILKKYKNVHIVQSDRRISQIERGREQIYKTYQRGIAKGEEVLKKLGVV